MLSALLGLLAVAEPGLVLDASFGYAGPLSYVQAKCIVAKPHCGTATARGPALGAGASVLFGTDRNFGVSFHGTIMGGTRDSVGGAFSAMFLGRIGTDVFAELGLGAGYAFARAASDWFSDALGPAATLKAGIGLAPNVGLFMRADAQFAQPGILGGSVGVEWRL